MASHIFSENSSTASDLNTDARGVGSNEMASLVQFQNTNVSLLPTSYGELAESFTNQVDPMAFHYLMDLSCGGVLDLSVCGASSNRVEVSGADNSHYVDSSSSLVGRFRHWQTHWGQNKVMVGLPRDSRLRT